MEKFDEDTKRLDWLAGCDIYWYHPAGRDPLPLWKSHFTQVDNNFRLDIDDAREGTIR